MSLDANHVNIPKSRPGVGAKRCFRQNILIRKREIAPGETRKVRARVPLVYGICDTPFGKSLAGISREGICHVSFFGRDNRTHLEEFARSWGNAENGRDDSAAAEALEDIFAPGKDGRPLKVLLVGTPFRLMVWEKLLETEEGRTLSYSELADSVGKPGSVRAVANAVANNPVAYIVPCHRVIAKTGALCGYRWGTDVKKRILEYEGVRADFS